MKETLRRGLERFFDAIVEKILAIEDYLCLPQNVHASEIALFMAAHLLFWWTLLFDVQNSSAAYRYIFSEAGWCAIFGFFSAMHLAGVWVPLGQFRQVAVYGYAIIWFVWLVMVSYGNHSSPVVPLVFILMDLSIYVSVRISREQNADSGAE